MTSKIFRLLSLGVVLLTAIACSLSDDDATTATASISGSLNETSANAKPRSAAGTSTNLVGKIEYTDGTTTSFSFTGTTLNFTATVVAGKTFVLTVYPSDDETTPYMSRYFDSLTSGTSLTGDDSEINILTTEHAERIITLIGGRSAFASTLLAATITGHYSTITNLMFTNGVFSASASNLAAAFVTIIANKFANVAAFDPTNSASYFTAQDTVDSTEVIEFETGTTTGTAAPGIVTAFSFPSATSTLGTSVAYTASVGDLDYEIDSTNNLVKFIASSDLVGSTVTLTVTASTGASVTATFTATITINELSISGEDLFTLNDTSAPYSLKYGPVSDGTNFYVVADKDGTYTIEKFSLSDLSSIDTSSGVQNLSASSTYAMARSFSDMIITGDTAYVVDSLSGVVKYDLTSTSATSFTSQTTTNFTASTLALAGTTLLAYNDTEDTFASLNTSSSSADVTAQSLSGTLDSNDDIGSVGSYLYVSGTVSGNYGYDFYNSSLALVDSFTSAYEYEFEQDASGLSSSFFGTSDSTSTVLAISFTDSSVVTTSYTTSLASSVLGISAINGSTLLTNSFTNTGKGYSMTSADNVTGAELNTQSSYSVDYESVFNVDEAYAMVINLPEGEAVANTTSRFFIPATEFTSSNTPTWFLKAYNMTSVTAE